MIASSDRDALLDRLLRYVRIETTADDTSHTVPSSPGQLDLSRLLADECRAMGLADVSLSDAGIVVATLPGTTDAPAIVWCSHVDTSPESPGKDVRPVVHENYDGGEIPLRGNPSLIITPAECGELTECVGHTLITSDGTTLLGADDKAGLAVIMTAVDILKRDGIAHGPVRLTFTTDEEIGRGLDHLDVSTLDAVCGYTLDGGGAGSIDAETFSADLATVTFEGTNIHPSMGKDKLVNAAKLLARFIDRLPHDRLSPETTADRDGFVHPYRIEGGVEQATATIILRSFETPELAEQADLLRELAESVRAEEPRCTVTVEVREQYRNMRDGMGREPRAVPLAEQAMRNLGIEPTSESIRGGTDGSLMTAQGLPTPNLSTGQHTPHSLKEWASLDEMAVAVAGLVELAKLWGQEK